MNLRGGHPVGGTRNPRENPMKKLLVWSLAAFCAATVGVDASSAQPPATPPAEVRTISVATLAPPGSTWMRVFESWNREVRRRSNKSLQMRFYSGGVQGDEAEVIRKIRNGRLDAAAV